MTLVSHEEQMYQNERLPLHTLKQSFEPHLCLMEAGEVLNKDCSEKKHIM